MLFVWTKAERTHSFNQGGDERFSFRNLCAFSLPIVRESAAGEGHGCGGCQGGRFYDSPIDGASRWDEGIACEEIGLSCACAIAKEYALQEYKRVLVVCGPGHNG